MNFAEPYFLFGTLAALLVGALLVWGSVRNRRAVARFGDPHRVYALQTADPSTRRAFKGVLLVLAVAVAFIAAARPQYGRGTRLVPATNIDVVIVLDYSKSMYAEDVAPSRIFRAKVEVARLIKDLPGARFAAVAFAGEAMAFPLTADGSAVAQFLRQLDPNDMPVGGTAIARALDQARQLLQRDPKSQDHKRVIVLITDGEDLEGNPVAMAQTIGGTATTIHVVQIGGRTPERIPEVGPDGRVLGYRADRNGRPLLTSLSLEGEKQLAEIAAATPEGRVIRSEKGQTGIEQLTAEIRKQMKGELSERVEMVYADMFQFPLGFAILLLLAEALLTDAWRRNWRGVHPQRADRPEGGLPVIPMVRFTSGPSYLARGSSPSVPLKRGAEKTPKLGATATQAASGEQPLSGRVEISRGDDASPRGGLSKRGAKEDRRA